MKKDVHPKLREVVFRDISCGFEIITLSTAETKETTEIKGKTYPLLLLMFPASLIHFTQANSGWWIQRAELKSL